MVKFLFLLTGGCLYLLYSHKFLGMLLANVGMIWISPRFLKKYFQAVSVYLHEISHGLMTIITKGKWRGFFASSTKGVSASEGGKVALITPAGYMGGTLIGSLMLLSSAISPNPCLAGMIFAALFATTSFKAVDMRTKVVGISFGLILFFTSLILKDLTKWVLNFIGLLLVYNGLLHLLHSLRILSQRDLSISDAGMMERVSGLRATTWSLIFLLFWLVCVGGVFVLAIKGGC